MTAPSRRTFLAGLAATLTPVGGSPLRFVVPKGPADLVLYNGEILTLDGSRVVQAVAITGGAIAAVGTDAAIRRWVGPKTNALDLARRAVVPGINDSHLHAAYWGLSRPPFNLDAGFPAVQSIADIVAAVARVVAAAPAGQWIRGRGWDAAYLAEGRQPTRQDLDPVSPDHPVALTDFSGHAVWANSKAMAMAGITRDREPPPGGVVVKDGAGEPTGVLFEGAAGLLRRVIPPFSKEETSAAIDVAIRLMHQEGITSFTEPGLDLATLELYAAKARAGALKSRLTVLLSSGNSPTTLAGMLDRYRPLEGLDPRCCRVAGIKILADGIPTGNKTAWLHEPYLSGGTGSLTIEGGSDDERVANLKEMIRRGHAAGMQIGTHATGDRAIDTVLDGYIEQLTRFPRPHARHYLIHADLVTPAALARMRRFGIGANFNPGIKFMIADSQAKAIGRERAAYEWPYRTALAAGVVIASSSDAPVTVPNWRQGLSTCIARLGKQSGEVVGPDQRIPLDAALRTYTTGGAWQDHAEAWKGRLTPGRVADLCVLDRSLLETPPKEIPEIQVSLTVAGGAVVFDRAGSSGS